MFCTNCGKKLPDGINFCPFCGTKILVITEEAAEEPVIEAPAVEESGPVVKEAVIEAAEPVVNEAEEITEIIEGSEPVIENVAAETIEPAAEVIENAEPVIKDAAAEAIEPVKEAIEPAAEAFEEAAPAAVAAIAEPLAEETVPIAEDAAAVTADETMPLAEETAPVAEAAAAEPIAEEAAAPKKKKTGLIAAIIAVVLIAAGVGGYFIYQNLPSTKLAKLRTQIDTAIDSNDFNGALGLIEQAYEFAPEDADLRKKYITCSETLLLDMYNKLQFEEFITEADKLIKDYPETAEELDPIIELAYHTLSNDTIKTKDILAMEAMKERLSKLTEEGRFNFKDEISWIDDNIEHFQLENTLNTLAAKLMPLIKAGDKDSVFNTIRTELISGKGSAHSLGASDSVAQYHFPICSDPDSTGKKLGIYYSKGHYLFYYGEYDGNRRNGNGIWICADNLKTNTSYREYWAEGPWSGDKPNGMFTIRNLSKYATSDKEQLIEATADVKDGLYNGKVTYSYDGSVPVTGTFEKGIAQVIMTTDPNGKEANVIMISEDGKTWVSRANISDPQGLYGFY